MLDALFRSHNCPIYLGSDNGPGLVSKAVERWLKDKPLDSYYIEPGSLWQNAYNETFNSIFRPTCLDRWLFSPMTEVPLAYPAMARGIQHRQAARIIGWYVAAAILTVLDPRICDSTNEIPLCQFELGRLMSQVPAFATIDSFNDMTVSALGVVQNLVRGE